MPLDNFITRPDYSRQLKQYTNTNAIFSGSTNILQKFSVKSIEIDTAGANDGDALIFDVISNKFSPNTPGSLGSRVIDGLILTYKSGLTYNVSSGSFRISSILYGYTGGTIDITSGLTSGSRFDVVFITSAATPLVSAGTTSINPSIPQLAISGEVQIGIIFVPSSFTGGTGTSIIQSTGSTFEFNNAAASAGIQRQGGVGSEATGDYSFSSNYQAKATGNYSSAIGYYAEASGISQTVVGQFNAQSDGYFIVGNGTGASSRSNAFRITTGGSAYVKDALFVNGVEIVTTGATPNQPLAFDGTKFSPQQNIKVNQITGASIFLSSGLTFISGYNSYSDPSDYTRILLSDEKVNAASYGGNYGGFPGESQFDIYQLNYFTEKISKTINPLTSGIYSSITSTTAFGYNRTAITITVGRESYVAITGITSGDTAIGTIFRNRFQTKDYWANNRQDNSSKNLVGAAFFSQFDSSRFNTSPVLGTLMETHLLGSQRTTRHNEVRNLQLGFFNKGWTDFAPGHYSTDPSAINVTTGVYDLYINRPVINAKGYNSFNNNEDISVTINRYASIFIESRNKKSTDDVLSRPLSTAATITYTNTPWSLFAEADRGYIGNTLVLASAQTLTSTTRGAWLDIGASQATRPHINLSAGTDPSSPQIGDLWWNGTQLYFRKDASTSVNLLSGGTGGPSGPGGIGTLQQVTDSGNTTTNGIQVADLSANTLYVYDTPNALYGSISLSDYAFYFNDVDNVQRLAVDRNLGLIITDINTNANNAILSPSVLTDIRTYNFPDRDGEFLLSDYETILYADAYANETNAQATLTPGKWYRIEAVDRGADETINFTTYGDVFLKAISTNRFSPDGYLLAINADYNGGGDYTDVSDFNTNHGVPYDGLVVGSNTSIITDVVIYNNRHWTTNSEVTLNTPSDITSNLIPLAKDYTSRYGYRIDVQKITIDIVTNPQSFITKMEDKRGNVVGSWTYQDSRVIETFRFGDNNVHNNQIHNGYFSISNYNDVTFYGNFVKIGSIQTPTILRPIGKPLSITNSVIQDNNFSIASTNGNQITIDYSVIQDGKIIGIIKQSEITNKTIILDGNSLDYYQDIFITSGTFNSIVTAITISAGITGYNQKFEFTNSLSQNITFRNSSVLKTEGGLDAVLKTNDSIEFYLNGSTAYQKNINNYL
jgi:hypothetical protein